MLLRLSESKDAIEAKREQLIMILAYGLGSQATQYYDFGSTSSSTSTFDVFQQNAEVIQQLQHKD